ncbi:GSCFA domain-containing protein [Parachitinimonas caeni]|uniref:GSCFA domain-containing protein n=1 Tax=Parachitinimonas caeni TaxID=3031301 RepID=A0ABT7E197_9NEIS|nr:GSCFA domain-containing protein [Parachitinimonas caeni]MDK2126029.1 GSCFA domain-containing protein [Parachitinimonas caeni]
MSQNPYMQQPPRAFWRSAIAERAMHEIDALWQPKFTLCRGDTLITAGSCFAQHISRALVAEGMHWLDAEPTPADLSAAEAQARNYGVFSFRTGNLYTAAMLRQWLEWALGKRPLPTELWQEGERWFDPLRPAIEPDGFASADAVHAAREITLQAIRTAVEEARCLVFTLGLTEAWVDRQQALVYPVCPGTVHGRFDADRHTFHNFRYDEIDTDLRAALALLREANPLIRILLTVSPVPLTATASTAHVLVANSHSKSVLRAVAGQLASELAYVDYFPSYELISSHPFKAAFYEPNLRQVTAEGVAFVMQQFFAAIRPAASPFSPPAKPLAADDLVCEDSVLDYYSQA